MKYFFIFFCCNLLFTGPFGFSQNSDFDKSVILIAEQMPRFKGGEEEMMRFIQKNIKYPVAAKHNMIMGVVFVTFIVDTLGGIKDIAILKSVSKDLDEEAIRVISLMNGLWESGVQNGNKVAVRFNLPIRFEIRETTGNLNYYNMGVKNAQNGLHKEAVKNYNEALRINPFDVDALYNRASSKYILEERERACEDWLRASNLGDKEALKMCETKCNPLFGIDTVWYNEAFERTYIRSNMVYYELSLKKPQSEDGKIVTTYYKSGQVKSVIDYSSYLKRYYTIKTYWDNNKLKRDDVFENGKFIKGKCFDRDGNEINHFDYNINPSFPGGLSEYEKFVKVNLKYPTRAKENGVTGEIRICFMIENDGQVTEIRRLQFKSLPEKEGLFIEAERIIRKMPKWTPGSIDGEIKRMLCIMPVKFSLVDDTRGK